MLGRNDNPPKQISKRKENQRAKLAEDVRQFLSQGGSIELHPIYPRLKVMGIKWNMSDQ